MRTIKQFSEYKKTKNKFKKQWDSVLSILLPLARRANERLISNDIISVQPMQSPIGHLLYIDYSYNNNFNSFNGEYFTLFEIKVNFIKS